MKKQNASTLALGLLAGNGQANRNELEMGVYRDTSSLGRTCLLQ